MKASELDALSPQGTVDQDGMADLAHKVRQEVEHFINGHIDDSTQGCRALPQGSQTVCGVMEP